MSTLVIRQGKTLRRRWLWCNPVPGSSPPVANEADPVEIVGYTARLQIRRRLGDADPILELTTENDGATIVGTAGTISIVATAEQTAELNFSSAVWDLEIEAPGPDGDVFEIDSGSVHLKREVTR